MTLVVGAVETVSLLAEFSRSNSAESIDIIMRLCPRFLDKRLVQIAENLYLLERFARSCAFVEGNVRLGLGLGTCHALQV